MPPTPNNRPPTTNHLPPTIDVLIVGAGPAGAIAALTLARAGVRVRLIDRAAFPRHKLCGDTVNPGALALLDRAGVGDAIRPLAIRITGMTVTGPHGATVAADYPSPLVGLSLTRLVLDQQLVEAAVAAGAAFDDRTAVKAPVVAADGRVCGVDVITSSGERRLEARLVIAADGRGSRLGNALGLTTFARTPKRWAFGAYYEGVAGMTSRGEMHVRRDGYIGLAPLPGGITNVCVVREIASLRSAGTLGDWRPADGTLRGSRQSPAAQCQPARVIEDAIAVDRFLRERFVNARRVGDVVTLGPLAVEARGAGCAGLLLAGDAAGFVDPMTGDGLRFALRGGTLAAEYALRELETGVPQHEALARARQREFAGKWRVNRALRALVASPRGVGLAAALAGRWPTPVRSLIAIAGDVPLALEYARS